jgi:glucokinase
MTRPSPSALGLDIGGTNLKAAVLQLPNRIALELKLPSRANEGPEGVRAALREAVNKAKSEGVSFERIGVGCAGSVDPKTGVVRNSPNFRAWNNVPLREWVQADHGLPVVVENDANCAAVTELHMGNALGCRNALLLTLGTGIGGGLILNGKIYRGATGTAGEVGHFSIHADGVACPCGNVGCFERYCSASSLAARVPNVHAKEIFNPGNRAKYGPVVDDFLRHLSIGLASLANILDPDVILLGGGLAGGLGPYWDVIRAQVKKHAFPAVAENLRLLPTQYENNSGALGAALLALEASE